jgi:hypothetical protein
VKYADVVVLQAKKEAVLQGMFDRVIETEGCYRMKMNVEKPKVMTISK